MNIQKLNANHYDESLKLSSYAFQYKIAEEEYKKRIKSLEDQDIFGCFDDGKLVAKLHVRPYHIWLNQQKIKMGGIAGVATYPEFRRKGYVKELMKHSLIEMQKNGQIISILHPFSYAFYRKYGWEILSNYIIIYLSKSDLIPKENVSGYIKRFTADSYNEDIETIYDKHAQKYMGMLARERNWWKDSVVKDFYVAIYYNQEHKPLGYYIYQIKNSKMQINEFVTIDHEARLGLWNYICQHDSMINELEMKADMNDPILFTILNPKVKVEQKAFGMARVVDVLAFLQVYPFNWLSMERPIIFNISDEHASWNNRTFIIEPNKPIEYINTDLTYKLPVEGLKMSINTFTALLLKYKTASELHEFGLITGSENDISKLDNMLPNKTPRFLDGF